MCQVIVLFSNFILLTLIKELDNWLDTENFLLSRQIDNVDLVYFKALVMSRLDYGSQLWSHYLTFDFGTPRSHEIKDENGVISKGWCVRDAVSSGFIN